MHNSADTRSFARDLLFELAKDSKWQREGYQFDRQTWFRQLTMDRKEETLFELEMYLRAIGCFFNLHNQFLDESELAITRDFSEELAVLRGSLARIAQLTQLLVDRGLASSLAFQSYIENHVAPDYVRLQLLRHSLEQKRPEESLFLLNRCLRDLMKVLDALLKREYCPYPLFYHFGQIVTREIAYNRFFNPLLLLEFRPEYDRIRIVEILDALRTIPNHQERLYVEKVFLALLRLLHYLRYVPRKGKSHLLRRSLILFTLFKSEATTLTGFLRVLSERSTTNNPQLREVVRSMGENLRLELNQIFGEHLVTIDLKSSKLYGDRERSVESSRAILDEFLKSCVVRLLQVYLPGADTTQIFDHILSNKNQAARLRLDLCIYRRLIAEVIESKRGSSNKPKQVPTRLSMFSEYFLQTSYNLLRYGDGEPFENYHAVLMHGLSPGIDRARWGKTFVEDTLKFRDCLSNTYDQVCRRGELKGIPLDEKQLQKEARAWLEKYQESAQNIGGH
jgi:hypothetical protein